MYGKLLPVLQACHTQELGLIIILSEGEVSLVIIEQGTGAFSLGGCAKHFRNIHICMHQVLAQCCLAQMESHEMNHWQGLVHGPDIFPTGFLHAGISPASANQWEWHFLHTNNGLPASSRQNSLEKGSPPNFFLTLYDEYWWRLGTLKMAQIPMS